MTIAKQRRRRHPGDVLSQSVVVFSKNYLPMSRINIKRAIALLVTGRAEPLEFMAGNGFEVRSPNLIMQVPEHIRLTIGGSERLWKVPPVNRREVLRRDNYTCQYCGAKHKLTLDHVTPRSKGGQHSWDNVVAACEQCNQRKGDRSPTEALMPLRAQPRPPMHPAVAFSEKFWLESQADLG